MFWSQKYSGPLEIPSGKERSEGIEVEQVENLGEYASKIRTRCRYNALNTGENRASVSIRRSELGEVKHTMHKPLPDAVFVAKRGEDVIGFMAVKRSIENGKKAQIRQLWTASPGPEQRKIMARLVHAAKGELTGGGYPRLGVQPINESTNFSVVRHTPEGGRYLRLLDAEVVDETTDIELSVEKENELPEEVLNATPEADNDNQEPRAMSEAA